MPVPTNTTAGTAIELGPLPNTLTQRVDDGSGTTYTVWYKYTAQAGDNVIGVFPFGDLATYKPSANVYLSDGVTLYPPGEGLLSSPNKRFQIPVTPGQGYYFKITPNAGNPAPANLTISGGRGPSAPIVAGSLLINDDTPGYPMCAMSPSGSVLNFVQGIVTGEGGAILKDGTLALTGDDEPAPAIRIYSSDLSSLIGTISNGTRVIGASNIAFYVSDNASAPNVFFKKYDKSGSSLATFGPYSTGGNVAAAIAPSRDDTVLYYIMGSGSDSLAKIKRWDLVNNVVLSNLYDFGTNQFIGGEFLVLSDGSLVFGESGSGVKVIRHLSAAGALLNTYDYSALGNTLDHLAASPNDLTSFWAWLYPSGNTTNRYIEFNVADGSRLNDFTIVQYEVGVYAGTATATPLNDFGPSFSCPFLVMRNPTVTAPSSPPVIPGTCCSPTPTSTSITSPKPSAGTNKGGVGSCTFYTGPSGVVPIGADPSDGDTLTGKRTVYVWAEVQHVDY